MAVYLVGFTVSLVIIAAVQKYPARSAAFIAGSVVALAIPCCIAGLRAANVGTDTSQYALGLYNAALGSNDFSSYWTSRFVLGGWNVKTPASFEPGFSLLVWMAVKLTGSFQMVLFLIQLFTVAPIYLALMKKKNDLPVWVGMTVYYLMFFNATLNMMRQWIALAFALLAMAHLMDGKKVACAAFFAIGLSFHSSAIFSVFAALMYLYTTKSEKGQLARAMSLFGAGLLVLLAVPLLALLLRSVGLGAYAGYLNGEIRIMPNQILLRLPMAAAIVLSWQSMKEKSGAAGFYMAMMLLDMVSSQLLSLTMGDAGSMNSRITMIFSEFYILSLPLAYRSIRDGHASVLYLMALVLYLLTYWGFTYVYMGYHETVPYVFAESLLRMA